MSVFFLFVFCWTFRSRVGSCEEPCQPSSLFVFWAMARSLFHPVHVFFFSVPRFNFVNIPVWLFSNHFLVLCLYLSSRWRQTHMTYLWLTSTPEPLGFLEDGGVTEAFPGRIASDGGGTEAILPGEASDCTEGVDGRCLNPHLCLFKAALGSIPFQCSITKCTFVRLPPRPWLECLKVFFLFYYFFLSFHVCFC